jgi:hypothetical protein
MMNPRLPLLRLAVAKAEKARGYGLSVRECLDRAIARFQGSPEYAEHCMKVMAMNIPKALLWQKMRGLSRR